jgi:hypothetical protein
MNKEYYITGREDEFDDVYDRLIGWPVYRFSIQEDDIYLSRELSYLPATLSVDSTQASIANCSIVHTEPCSLGFVLRDTHKCGAKCTSNLLLEVILECQPCTLRAMAGRLGVSRDRISVGLGKLSRDLPQYGYRVHCEYKYGQRNSEPMFTVEKI